MTVARAVVVFGLTVLMCAVSGLLAMRKLKAASVAELCRMADKLKLLPHKLEPS